MSTDLAMLIELREPGPLLEAVYRRPRWHLQAACRGKPIEWFFPAKGQPSSYAKAVCAECPVIDRCAQAGAGEAGIWAGVTERQRRKLRGVSSDVQ